MPRTTWAAAVMVLSLIALAGCADNPMVLQGRVTQYQTQQSALQNQNELFQKRIDMLDDENQHTDNLLARSQQQNKLLEDRLTAVSEQLRSTTDQLAQIRTRSKTSTPRPRPSQPACGGRPASRSRPTTASCRRCRRSTTRTFTSAAMAT